MARTGFPAKPMISKKAQGAILLMMEVDVSGPIVQELLAVASDALVTQVQ